MKCELCPDDEATCGHLPQPAIVPFVPRKTKPRPKVKARLSPVMAKMAMIDEGKWCEWCDTPYDPHFLCQHLREERFAKERAEVYDWLTNAERWNRETNGRGVGDARTAAQAMRRVCFRAGRDEPVTKQLPRVAVEAIKMRKRTGVLLRGTKPLSTPGGDELPI